MRKYQCHKVVEAARILSITDDRDSAPFFPDLEDGSTEEMPFRAWAACAKDVLAGNPLGYLVRYEDGYISYSPAAVFEAGYREIPDAEWSGAAA